MADNQEFLKKSFQNFTKKSPSIDLSVYEFGKLPPQALDFERAVLGALLIDGNAMDSVGEILVAESFYTDAHQMIFKAIFALSSNEKPVDLLTVTEQLRRHGNLDKVG